MNSTRIAPYGSWKSPITSDAIISDSFGLGQIGIDGEDLYWTEVRPWEEGRSVLVRYAEDGVFEDVTPRGFSVRSRVHEYGGGAFTVEDSIAYFCNFSDQRLYKQTANGPVDLTSDDRRRYADLEVDLPRNRIICVSEDHANQGTEPVNSIVDVNLGGRFPIQTLVTGNDFYSSPRVSPNGARLCWLTWNHPNMPWNETELWVADLTLDGTIENTEKIPSGSQESIGEPQWSPDGTLYFVSDRTGWWNLYQWDGEQSVNILPMETEFSAPQWQFGVDHYGFVSKETIVCSYAQNGVWHVAALDTTSGDLRPYDVPFTDLSRAGLKVGNGWAALMSGSPTQQKSVVKVNLDTGEYKVVRTSSSLNVPGSYFAVPETVEFPTENGKTAHAFFYEPRNPKFQAPSAERPPLVVISHGGPSGATSATLDLNVQFWTSRGFALLDVNYGGSTGYGTEYRGRINERWGVVDVDDCVNGALHIVGTGRVDSDRLIIRGNSAGGYTTLACLTFRDIFKAGASFYGIGDLETLARDTHKFESRYLNSLVGPYPETRDIYVERSPINHVDRLSCPVIIFQGLDDDVVPPIQAEKMVQALRERGIPVAYLPFEDEQHGFRKGENIKAALDAELYFYSQVFGFDLADAGKPIEIHNLKERQSTS